MIQEMDLMEIFYWFHRHPELSYEEYDTTAQIKKLLKAADVKILPIPMETGLIAEVKGCVGMSGKDARLRTRFSHHGGNRDCDLAAGT